MTSFPVPVSPAIRTAVFVGATASTRDRMPRRLPRRPTIVSTNGRSSRSSSRAPSSSLRYAMSFIGMFSSFSLICITGLEAELIFPPTFLPTLAAWVHRSASPRKCLNPKPAYPTLVKKPEPFRWDAGRLRAHHLDGPVPWPAIWQLDRPRAVQWLALGGALRSVGQYLLAEETSAPLR